MSDLRSLPRLQILAKHLPREMARRLYGFRSFPLRDPEAPNTLLLRTGREREGKSTDNAVGPPQSTTLGAMEFALRAKAIFASQWLYVGWGLASAGLLTVAAYIDPYVFGLSAFVAAALSGLLVLGAAVLNRRSLVWALVAAIPTALAFWRLSTYKWA